MGEPQEVVWLAGKCGKHHDPSCTSCRVALDYNNAEMERLRAALRIAAQRYTSIARSRGSRAWMQSRADVGAKAIRAALRGDDK